MEILCWYFVLYVVGFGFGLCFGWENWGDFDKWKLYDIWLLIWGLFEGLLVGGLCDEGLLLDDGLLG